MDGNMNILITGGWGFIGRNLVEHFSADHYVSAPSSSELNLLDAGVVRQYLCANHFDAIIHAATTRCNRRVTAPADMLDRNCRMFFNLARNDGLFGKMIHFGSGAEYDRAGLPARVREDYFDTRVPDDPYGFSKYICAKHIERSERIANLRLFGVFGKYEDYTVRFISNACCRVLKGLPILIRQDIVFDYLWAGDLATITEWFLKNEPRYKTYNVCTGKGVRLSQLAAIVACISGKDPQISIAMPGLTPEYTGNNSLLLDELGDFEFARMEASIAALYSWYEENLDRIELGELRFDG